MISKLDLAKYPFIKEAADYVKKFGFKIEDFEDLDYEGIINTAASRIKNSALTPLKHSVIMESGDLDIEILSFPVAVMMVKNIRDSYFQKRFALAESKKASANLENESTEKIIEIATKNFGWNISKSEKFPEILKVDFNSYLKNASKLHEDKWKLINRYLEYGEVHVIKAEAARLLEEEIKDHIQSKFENSTSITIPKPILDKISELESFLEQYKKVAPVEQFMGKVDVKSFPPCMRNMYLDILAGKNVPHYGRFSLTAFLVNIGMESEEIVKLYTSATDFDENITRYQVLHIAGLTGGKTKYKPSKCSNMQTHRLCLNADEICRKIRSPLTYYKIKRFRI